MNSSSYSSLVIIISLHTVKWYQVFLFNTNDLHTVMCFQEFLSYTTNFQIDVRQEPNRYYLSKLINEG